MADRPSFSFGSSKRGMQQDQYKKLKPLQTSSIADAVVKKLVPALIPRPTAQPEKKTTKAPEPDHIALLQSTNKVANAINDARNMRSVLPDIEMVEQLLVSSILSPHDLLKTELNFRIEDDVLREYGQGMLTVIENYFKKDYKIEAQLERSLKKILFNTGSHILAVIPENAIDEIINGGGLAQANESLASEFFAGGHPRPYGILGPTNRDGEKLAASRDKTLPAAALHMSFESMTPHFGYNDQSAIDTVVATESFKLSVTDNPNILKTPIIREELTRDRLAGVFDARRIMQPSAKKKDDDKEKGSYSKTYSQLFKRRSFGVQQTLAVPTSDVLTRKSIGHPLVMQLPSESVIPVHVPGSPEKHLGYYVAIDQTGFPVTLAATKAYLDSAGMNLSVNTDLKSVLSRETARMGGSLETMTMPQQLAEMNRVYCELVEDDLTMRLHNGVYGPGAQLSRPSEVYAIMLARTLAGKDTRLLFIPGELVTYMAFDFDDMGRGVSLMEQNKNTGVIRSILTMANTLGAINNSVNHVKVNLKLDPDDSDPHSTVDMVQHEIARTRQFNFPTNINSMSDLADVMQRAGISMAVTGNELYPETEVDVENIQSQRVEVNTDLDESMKKRHYLGFGVTPEQVDQTTGADFASSVLTQNLLTAKRAFMYGKEYSAQWTDHIRKYAFCDETLLDALRECVRKMSVKDFQAIVNETKGLITTEKSVDKAVAEGVARQATDAEIEMLVMTFIDTVSVSLPEPDLTQFKIQHEAYTEYVDGLDSYLDAVINEDMYTSENMGEISATIGQIRAAMKAELQRRWLIQNNVMPELFDLINLDGAQKEPLTLLDRHKKHLDTLAKSLLGYAKVVTKRKETYDAIFGAIGGEGGSDDSGTSSDDEGTVDDNMGGGEDDFSIDDAEASPEEGMVDENADPGEDKAAEPDASAVEEGEGVDNPEDTSAE